jgi:hypothetical protein
MVPMDAVVTFYCVHCAKRRMPQNGPTQLDPRFTLGMCDGVLRQLVDDQEKAQELAHTTGKFKRKTPSIPRPRRVRL